MKGKTLAIMFGGISLVLFLVFVGLIIFFTFGQQSILMGSGFSTSFSLGEKPEYWKADLSWSVSTPSDACGDASHNEETLEFTTAYNLGTLTTDKIPTDIPYGKKFEAHDVTFNGLTAFSNPCSDNTKQETSFVITEQKQICELKREGFGVIFCTHTLKVKPTSDIPLVYRGPNSGSGIVDMYKTGFSPPVIFLSYYRLENNLCSSIQIEEKDKVSNDYLTLTECESNIELLVVNDTIIDDTMNDTPTETSNKTSTSTSEEEEDKTLTGNVKNLFSTKEGEISTLMWKMIIGFGIALILVIGAVIFISMRRKK